ncbi:MAG: hypothetical protein HC765_16460 [Brachymonas sp.]|nr:hypothetical protein [Brachymonas sp.]
MLVVATGMGLVACGGDGGGSSAPSASPVMLTGQAVKGPVIGGQVCAYTLTSPRQQIACATTDANAKYSLALPEGTGEVLLEVTGGTYVDEATGKTVALSDPLRTISKAGDANNALITPFTELAIQRASVSNPGGNLEFGGFNSEIGQLETSLGISGLANGNPFGSKATDDQNHQKALAAFAQLQNGQKLDVAGALQIMGSQLDKCGPYSLAVSLAVYSAGSTVSNQGGIQLTQLSSPQNILLPSNSLFAKHIFVDSNLPNPCSDELLIDGTPANFADLASPIQPIEWQTATKAELLICSNTKVGINAAFPQAALYVNQAQGWEVNYKVENGGTLNISPNVTFSSAGGTSLPVTIAPGAPAIDLQASGIVLNKNGCYQSTSNLGFSNISISTATGGSTIGGSVVIGGGGGGGGGGLVLTGGK